MNSSAVREAASNPSIIPASDRLGWLGRSVRAVVRAYNIGRCRSALSTLSDHTLKDIGISRSEIPFLAEALVDDRPDPTRLPRSARVR